jgi:hypothetical protein
MHVMAWAPSGITPQDSPSYFWFVYYWQIRPDCHWQWNKSTSGTSEASANHPSLARNMGHLLDQHSGRPSYVGIGETSTRSAECFFIRATDAQNNWSYRFDGLPNDCQMALQNRFTSKEPDKEDGQSRLVHGRVRAVVFGYGGSWIMYGGSTKDHGGSWHEWNPVHFPAELNHALNLGEQNDWTINVS